jgi:hypothetical protein
MLDIKLILLMLLLDLFFSLLCTSILALKLTAFVTVITEERFFVGSDNFANLNELLLE